MKKLILIVCAVAAFAALAEDSYLYWMVDDAMTLDGTEYDWAKGDLTAKVVAYDNNTGKKSAFLNLYGQDDEGALVPVSGVNQVTVDGESSPFYAGIAFSMQPDNWSYYIELYNDTGFFGRSETALDYSTAQTMEYLRTSTVLTPGNFWNVTAFTPRPVPEPNSALLMLIGCAALALRRRKPKGA